MPRTSGRMPSSVRIGWRTGSCCARISTLFDAGYVTVTPSLELRVSRRIREEFENGRDYYALEGSPLRVPLPPAPRPSAEYLEWHGDTVFRG